MQVLFGCGMMPSMGTKETTAEFSPEEATHRFEAALRGARIAGSKHNEGLTPKRKKTQQTKPRKPKNTSR
jgi:hypothetical protein